MGSVDWQTKAAAKREACLAKIPKEWLLPSEYLHGDESSSAGVLEIPAKSGILTQAELDITEQDAAAIGKAVQSGTLKAEDVATAFSKRAAIAQQLTNCLTETFFEEGIARGKWLDEYLAKNGKPIGPLHGIPISIKDCLKYKGTQSTLGFVSFLDNPVDAENSPLVDVLLKLGAILYCKTNIPQTLMTADSHNNVFGRTLNPNKLKLTAGGSSGGEGALVAFKGSAIGVGTDIGGSIRIPSICNGTYGFKPTPNRIVHGGQRSGGKSGSPGFPACTGPLANTFNDLVLFTQSVIESEGWNKDPTTLFYPWRATVADAKPSKIRIGYYAEDPEFPTHPPVRRALEESAKALAAAGFEVLELKDTPSLKTAVDLSTDYWSMDNTRSTFKNIEKSGEPLIPSLAKTISTVNKKPESGYTLEELFDINALVGEYKALWHDLWVKNKLDVVLCPPAQTTAVPHDEYGTPHYTVLWNLLAYPALIIPVGKADKSIDTDDLTKPEALRKYNAEDVDGAPTTIQLVTRNMQDEELIAISRVIDQTLKAVKA